MTLGILETVKKNRKKIKNIKKTIIGTGLSSALLYSSCSLHSYEYSFIALVQHPECILLKLEDLKETSSNRPQM